jgi:hypothetical protein
MGHRGRDGAPSAHPGPGAGRSPDQGVRTRR